MMTKDEALKMAIEVLWSVEEYDETGVNIAKKAINACKEALEPEPMTTTDVITCKMVGKCCMTGEALEQPAQEPVEYLGALPNVDGSVNLYFKKDQWQGLTDNEKLSSIRKWAENNTMRGQELIGLCDSIEQALKDKNA
jgi:hypothetical protein